MSAIMVGRNRSKT